MAPADFSPIEKIDYYTDQLSGQMKKLRRRQLIQAQINQWQQLQQWHRARGEKEQAEADEEQIQTLQHSLVIDKQLSETKKSCVQHNRVE